MVMNQERLKSIGGRCFDVAMGLFLVAILVLVWTSSRGKGDSASRAATRTNTEAGIKSSSNVEALLPLQGTVCSITCPANITTLSTGVCTVVNFPAPTTTPGFTCTSAPVCVPTSGSCFPVGTTTVNCTAPNFVPGQCSFTVTVNAFDVCLQDDANPSTVFLGNSVTGEYRFCCGGTTFTGVAQVSRRGSVVAFAHYPPDRRVQAITDGAVFKGTAALQSPPGTIKCTIGDRDTRNNTCVCGAVPVE